MTVEAHVKLPNHEIRLPPLDQAKQRDNIGGIVEFNDPYYDDSRLLTPAHGAEQFPEAVMEALTYQDFEEKARELQRLIDEEGWGSIAMMLEVGDPKLYGIITHDNSWAEAHFLPQDGQPFERKSCGLLLTPEIMRYMDREGLTIGEVPPQIILLACIQRIEAMRWINTQRNIDRLEEMNAKLRSGDRVENLPFFHPEIEAQIERGFEVNEEGIPILSVKEIFPSMRPALQAIHDQIYETRGSNEEESRKELVEELILTQIGKYMRLETAAAPMPTSAGALEYLSTTARMMALSIVPRNYIFANIDFRVDFTKKLLEDLDNRTIPTLDEEYQEKAKKLWKQNVSVAIGINDAEIESIDRFLEIGVRSFRLYTVATDSRMMEQLPRIFAKIDAFKAEHPDEEIELFIGQMTHEDQLGTSDEGMLEESQLSEEEQAESFLKLINGLTPEQIENYIDGLFFGNGGGSMCSTASTGMGVNTLLLLYQFRNDPRFKNVSMIVEGGITLKEFPLVQYGAHGESLASQGVAVESPGGQLALVSKRHAHHVESWTVNPPDCAKPQCGEASIVGARTEDRMDGLTENAIQLEGQPGIKKIDPKMPSIAQILKERTKYLSQIFVKLGVRSIEQLHALGVYHTAEAMERTFGPNWRNQRDLTVTPKNHLPQLIEHIKQLMNAPDDIDDATILKIVGINDMEQDHYIIPTQMRLATPTALNEGSPHGAGLTGIK